MVDIYLKSSNSSKNESYDDEFPKILFPDWYTPTQFFFLDYNVYTNEGNSILLGSLDNYTYLQCDHFSFE